MKSSSSSRTESEINSIGRQALGSGDTDVSHIPTGTQIDISYEARMRAMHSTSSQSVSTVTHGDEVIEHQLTTNLSAIVSHVIGRDAHIEKPALSLSTALMVGNQNSLAIQQYAATEAADQQPGSAQSDLTINNLQLDVQQITEDMLNVSGRVNANNIVLELQETRLDVHQTRLYEEHEQMRFSSQGTLTTEDGREINFMLELDMERSFELEESFEMNRTERRIVDPLMLNLHGGAAELTSTSFRFDLDGDGFEEEISSVTGGTGFLALDSNNDGVINDGTELFGTQGMDGFSDLARHDSDGNMWIDENDAVFEELKVWTRDAEGNDQLTSLKDAGVGAIYLGSSESSFDLKDGENNLLGTVKRSGVFLSEDGQVASIQELDLAIHAEDIRSVMAREGHAIAVNAAAGENITSRTSNGEVNETHPEQAQQPPSSGSEAEFLNRRDNPRGLEERFENEVAFAEQPVAPVIVNTVVDIRAAQFIPGEASATEVVFESHEVGGYTPDVRKTDAAMTEAVQSRSTSTTVSQTSTADDSANEDPTDDIQEVVRKFIFDEQKLDLFKDLHARTEHRNAQQASSLAIMKETIFHMRKAMEAETTF